MVNRYFGSRSNIFPGMGMSHTMDTSSTAAIMGTRTIDTMLDAGMPALVGVDRAGAHGQNASLGFARADHAVLIVGRDRQGRYLYLDPARRGVHTMAPGRDGFLRTTSPHNTVGGGGYTVNHVRLPTRFPPQVAQNLAGFPTGQAFVRAANRMTA